MNNKQHQEDTKYVQWQDGMYVMLDALLCDYEAALVENSLRGSVYFYRLNRFVIKSLSPLILLLYEGFIFSSAYQKLLIRIFQASTYKTQA